MLLIKPATFIFLLLITFVCFAEEDKYTVEVGLYNPINTTNAEYGSGPKFVLKVDRRITDHISFSVMHESYIFEGSPFGQSEDSESGGNFAGFTGKWSF